MKRKLWILNQIYFDCRETISIECTSQWIGAIVLLCVFQWIKYIVYDRKDYNKMPFIEYHIRIICGHQMIAAWHQSIYSTRTRRFNVHKTQSYKVSKSHLIFRMKQSTAHTHTKGIMLRLREYFLLFLIYEPVLFSTLLKHWWIMVFYI